MRNYFTCILVFIFSAAGIGVASAQLTYKQKKIKYSKYFQGNHQKKQYFEGWYFKLVSADEKKVYAIIPGLALGNEKEAGHAFIQLIDGATGHTAYFRFPLEAFSFTKKKFSVSIGDNFFSDEKIVLAIPDALEGEVHFSQLSRYPAHFMAPGIMGWFRFVPFLQTYHGVVSLDHELSGKMKIQGKDVAFDQGRGYIEKDWGRSFPASWIWMQSNHFEDSGTSFMMSVADIPWIGQSFTGFLGFFQYQGKVYRFATYTNAKLDSIRYAENEIFIKVQERAFSLEISATRSQLGILAAPQNGVMERRIAESLDAHIQIRFWDKKGKLLYEGTGSSAGLEMVGEVPALIDRLNR